MNKFKNEECFSFFNIEFQNPNALSRAVAILADLITNIDFTKSSRADPETLRKLTAEIIHLLYEKGKSRVLTLFVENYSNIEVRPKQLWFFCEWYEFYLFRLH